MTEKNPKFDWSKYGSLRVPNSVIEQVDKFKDTHGYTSRPQAIIAALEKAEKSNIIEDFRDLLDDYFEKNGYKLVKNI